MFIFIVLGLTALYLQEQRERNAKAEADKAQAELLSWQRGDTANPPRFGIAHSINPDTQALSIRFLMENPSQYPAYEINGRLWDLDAPPPNPLNLEGVLKQDILTINVPSLAGNAAQILKNVEISPGESSKRFAAQYVTRTGNFTEKIRAERVNGKWLFAFQVRRFGPTDEIMFERVDSDFPKDESGQVDWSMKRPSSTNPASK